MQLFVEHGAAPVLVLGLVQKVLWSLLDQGPFFLKLINSHHFWVSHWSVLNLTEGNVWQTHTGRSRTQ